MSEKKHKWYKSTWIIQHLDINKNIIFEDVKENALADEGESSILDTYFRATSSPTAFYVRLFNDTPTETDSLSDLTGEPSGNGYASATIERSIVGFPTLESDSGDYQVVSKQVTFTASGGEWSAVTYAVLSTTTDNTGKLVAYVALSQARTLADGESLRIQITIKLQ